MVSEAQSRISLQKLETSLTSLPANLKLLLREYIGASLNNLVDSLSRLVLLQQSLGRQGNQAAAIKALEDHIHSLLTIELGATEESHSSRAKLCEALTLVDPNRESNLKQIQELGLEQLVEVSEEAACSALGALPTVQRVFEDFLRDPHPVPLRLQLRDGQFYEGGSLCGRREGEGKLTYANGDIYSGDWRKGQRHGHGDYLWKSKARYTGEYVHNVREGQGTFQFIDNSVYEGEWRQGIRHGKGRMRWENGDTYEGDFIQSKRTGKGTFTR